MAKSYVQPGESVTVIAPVGGVASGDGLLIGSLFGIAHTTQVAGAEVEIGVVGVWDLPKSAGAGTALTAGGPAYWDATAKKVTGVATPPNVPIGLALLAAGDSAAVVRVRLFGGIGWAVLDAGVAATLADHESRITALEPP